MATTYPNSGALWPNEKRETESHPNVRGDIKVTRALLKELMANSSDELVTIALSGWTRTYNGNKFISLKADKPYVPRNQGQKSAPAQQQDDDDEIPF